MTDLNALSSAEDIARVSLMVGLKTASVSAQTALLISGHPTNPLRTIDTYIEEIIKGLAQAKDAMATLRALGVE